MMLNPRKNLPDDFYELIEETNATLKFLMGDGIENYSNDDLKKLQRQLGRLIATSEVLIVETLTEVCERQGKPL